MATSSPHRVVAATRIITPDSAVVLAGVIGRTQPFESVHDGLEVNVVLLESNRRILFVSFDLLFVGAEIADFVYGLAESHGVDREFVVMTASHTHFAPATDKSKPLLGKTDPGFLHNLKTKLRELFNDVFSQPREEATLELTSTEVGLNIGRRRLWPFPTLTHRGLRLKPTTIMSPNDSTPVDSGLDVLRLTARDGRLLAVIWKYACHPVAFPEQNAVSAEFPGYVRAALRSKVQRAVPVVFWQGFSGDVRPRLFGNWTLASCLRALRCGPTFRPVNLEDWQRWAEELAQAVVKTMFGPALELDGRFELSQSQLALDRLIDAVNADKPSKRVLRIQRLSFGKALSVLFVSAEVCSPYLRSSPDLPVICVGCVADVFGYLPSDAQIREGGYESEDHFPAFGLEGRFRPHVEQKVNALIQGLRTQPASSSAG